jgi:DNA repair protein RadD
MIKLRWYQKAAVDAVLKYWSKNKDGNPIIALPTGSGKSLTIAALIHYIIDKYDIEIIVLSHVKEILEQNKSALEKYLVQMDSDINIGLYSAGLGSKTIGKVTIAGIQSAHRNADLFKNAKLVIVDEAHRVPPSKKEKTMYVKFMESIGAKALGLTATPYRLGDGYIVGEDFIFDKIVIDLTQGNNYNRLVKEGYLAKIISKKTSFELNPDGIPLIAGDYSEKELALRFDKDAVTDQAVHEIVKQGVNYKRWLIFAINIEHAEHIVNTLHNYGISAIPVHSKMDMDRDLIIKAFRNGQIKALVNVNILTTGIDIPEIDLVALLRPTKSPVIYVQSVGRGGRPAEGKDHCLVLDFAKVVATHGAINAISISKKRKGKKGEPVMKACPNCNTLYHPSVRICEICGYEFEFKKKISSVSDGLDIVSNFEPEWYNVDEVLYNINNKINGPKSIRISYRCGMQVFNDWLCLEHTGYAKRKANNWIRWRIDKDYIIKDEMGNSESMIKVIDKIIKKPKRILVKKSGKYPDIIDYEF